MRVTRLLPFVSLCFLTFLPLYAEQNDLLQLLKSGTVQDVLQALHNGSLDARGKAGNGYPWIVWAALFNPDAEVISLLLKAGADVNASGGINNSTPLGAAAWNNTPEVVSLLLEAGARVGAADKFGATPLMAAAVHNPKAREVIALLLKSGADVNARDYRGRTALDYARHDPTLPALYVSRTQDPAIYQDLLAAGQSPPAAPGGADGSSLQLAEPSFDDIYPVFHNYYDTHPLGSVVLRNTSGWPISGITVHFQIKEFMADPKDCPAPSHLAPGESASVGLLGLILPAILQTTEKTKTQGRIDVEYTLNGRAQHQSLVQSIPILNRNATSWSDDRRAAAFVTVRDPSVLAFSKNVNSMVRGKIQGAVNPNLLTAIAFFQSLQLYGLTYSQDPIPTLTANSQVADFIQFPRETLQYKGGKCSDFSVLYTSLLESVGIETAFITIPGHIFIAFSIDMSPDEAGKAFSRAEELIFRDEKSWIPVEVTESAGFLRAWQDGVREWRESSSNNQAAFLPLHDAWRVYEPVALPGAEVAVDVPPAEKIVSAYQAEALKFIDQQISTRVAELRSQIAGARDPRKPTNGLGVLYARYGQYDRAQKEFGRLLAKEEYVPALLNMGNIFYLSERTDEALKYYNRAYAQDPENPEVLLAVARTNHDLENYSAASRLYAELKKRDPDLARRFAYLGLMEGTATRASNAAGLNAAVIWEE